MVVSDQGPINRALYAYLYIKGFEVDEYDFLENKCIGLNGTYKRELSSKLSDELNKVQFSAKYGETEIPLIYDYCHLFKSVRNTLLKYDLKTTDGLVSYKIYEQIYNNDFNKPVKICPKITKVHIYPNSFQKMSVKLAVQVFSNSVAGAIQSLIPLNVFEDKEIATSTLKFTKKLNKLFDILNGKFHLRLESEEYQFLVEMMEYFQNIKPVTINYVKFYCFDGMVQTIKGMLAFSLEIMRDNNINNFSLKAFNQDDCENTFSKIRGRNGFKQNPSASEIRSIMGRITSIDLIYNSAFSNCENTDSENLPIDWKIVLEEDLVELPNKDPDCGSKIQPTEKQFNSSDEIAVRYYAGYCVYKLINSMQKNSCDGCKLIMMKQSSTFDDKSEALIFCKNYDEKSDFGSLFPPSNLFFEICKLQVTNKVLLPRFLNKLLIFHLDRSVRKKLFVHYLKERIEKRNSCRSHR